MHAFHYAPDVVTAAVVGAGGFIGRHLVAGLAAAGMPTTGYTKDDGAPWRTDPRVVFYLASSITPALAESDPDRVSDDYRAFATFLAGAAGRPDPPTVVLASSGGTVYDPDLPPPYREDSRTRSTSRYGAAKLALEHLLADYARIAPTVVARLSNVYGPGQRLGRCQGVLAHWLHAAAEGYPLHLIGDPRAVRDYVFIDDVVDCLCRIAGQRLPPSGPLVLNVGSGEGTSLARLLAVVEEVVGRELPVRRQPSRAVDRAQVWLDVRRVRQVLGWRPRTPLVDGVHAMWRQLTPAQVARIG